MWRKLGQAAMLVGLGLLAGVVLLGRVYAKARGGGLLSRLGGNGSSGPTVSGGVVGARENLSGLRDGRADVDRGVDEVERGADSISAGHDDIARGQRLLVSTNQRLRAFIERNRGSEPGATEAQP